jgi:NAD(P)-dependent dehydrogenase (short-subunit alcohol dehydrogenase family)
MRKQRVAIIGGSSGIGLRVAERAIDLGADVVIGGRDAEKLQRAASKLGPASRVLTVDNVEQDSLRRFFEQAGPINHLFTPGASYSRGRIDKASDEVAESSFRS